MKDRLAKRVAGLLLAAVSLTFVLVAGCKRVETKSVVSGPSQVPPSGSVDMVLIDGGSFQMGSDRESEPDEVPHEVRLSPFYIDKYEVTQKEYERVVGKNPSRCRGEKNPVEQIRWTDAAQYCNARSLLEGLQPAYDPETWQCDFSVDGYRLPTEAEWEYAARAGTETAYCFGSDPSQLDRYAWYKKNSTRGPHPVGLTEPNAWGLYDMYGNVWEWCNDFYQEGYYRESLPENPRGPESSESRVVRGGCWNSRPDVCRSSYRNYELPRFTDACFAKEVQGFVGFRCVRNYRP